MLLFKSRWVWYLRVTQLFNDVDQFWVSIGMVRVFDIFSSDTSGHEALIAATIMAEKNSNTRDRSLRHNAIDVFVDSETFSGVIKDDEIIAQYTVGWINGGPSHNRAQEHERRGGQ